MRHAVAWVVSVSTVLGWSLTGAAEERPAPTLPPATALSTSIRPLLSGVPTQAARLAPNVSQVVELFDNAQHAQARIRQLRSEQDGLKTEIISSAGELESLGEHRAKLQEQLGATERQRQERLVTLRQELETRLQTEMRAARQQITKELETDFARQAQAFEARQRELIDQGADQELRLTQQEMEQLGHELQVLAQELKARLSRLDGSSAIESSLEESLTVAVGKRQAALQAQQDQLEARRKTLLAERREEFAARLRAQQDAEQQERLTVKEANLRQAMAQLLRETVRQEGARVSTIQHALDEATQRERDLASREASLNERLAMIDQDLVALGARLDELEIGRQASLVRLDEAIQQMDVAAQAETLAWFGRIVQVVPAELSTELGVIQQHAVSRVEQEQRLAEQRRVLRDRQLALQVSRETQDRLVQEQRAREQALEAKSAEIERLLADARQLSEAGNYDQALQLVARAHSLNPPRPSVVEMVREDILTARSQVLRQVKAQEMERTFAQAMDAFNDGSYEDAIKLFEAVIAEDTPPAAPSQQVAGTGPEQE